MTVSSSLFDAEAARAAARNAKVQATYQVTSFGPAGPIIRAATDSLSRAFSDVPRDGSISTITIDFNWRLGVRSGSGTVVYDTSVRFPAATRHLAERTIRNLMIRRIAEEFVSLN